MNTAIFLHRRTAVAIAFGVLLIAGAAVAVFGGHAERAAAAPAPAATPVSVAKVLARTVTVWSDFSGRVEAVDQVDIRPRISGTIDAVHFQEGQLVQKGALLFTIDPRPYRAELARAVAAQAGARAALSLAQTELERTRKLLAAHAVAQRELDTRQNAWQEADANLKAADAAVLTARLDLQYTEVRAPIAGRISRAEITVGNLVEAGSSAPVLTRIESVSPMYVNFEIDEPTYIRYAEGGAAGNSGVADIPVEMGLSNEAGYPHDGRIRSFDNRVDDGSGTIRVRAVFDNAKGMLTPGMFARVRIGTPRPVAALLVDDKAIGTDQDKKYVMVVGADNKAVYRAVTLGPVVDGLRIIRSGLKKDERIVVDGLQRIRPNDTVAPQMVPMDAHVANAAASEAAAE